MQRWCGGTVSGGAIATAKIAAPTDFIRHVFPFGRFGLAKLFPTDRKRRLDDSAPWRTSIL